MGIQKETPIDPVKIIADKITGGNKFLTDLIVTRITAIRGYFDEVFANRIHTKEICVKKSDGGEVCVNGDQLDRLLPSPTPTAVPLTTPGPSPTASAGESPTGTPEETSSAPTAAPTESPTPSESASPAPTASPI